MAYIKTVTLFTNNVVGSGSAGGTSISDVIDLRDEATMGRYSISYRVKCAGANTSCGTTGFAYLSSPTRDGVYVQESSQSHATAGTTLIGATGGTGLWRFEPYLTPFMKIRAIVGTSGTAVISAELNVQ
jgi:hypothetical protein